MNYLKKKELTETQIQNKRFNFLSKHRERLGMDFSPDTYTKRGGKRRKTQKRKTQKRKTQRRKIKHNKKRKTRRF